MEKLFIYSNIHTVFSHSNILNLFKSTVFIYITKSNNIKKDKYRKKFK